MRIYRERVSTIAGQLVEALLAEELIEVDAALREEVELDLASVLSEYRRMDQELSESAKDLVANRNLDYSYTQKFKSQLAQQKGFGLGDDGLEWIITQMVEILLQSKHVDEVYGEDHDLRRVIAPVLRKELGVEQNLDAEVKKRLKNLAEGTSDYDIEYQRTLEQIRKAKRLGG
jgi:hypothetical protein